MRRDELASKIQMDCVKLAEAIYEPAHEYENLAEELGYPHTFFHSESSRQMAVTANNRWTLIVFSGNGGFAWNHVRRNFCLSENEWTGAGRVNRHYVQKAHLFFPSVRRHIKKYPLNKIIILGHSLGGALAVLTAAKLEAMYDLADPDYVITYGAPRVGDDEFTDSIKTEVLRYENRFDLVPLVPKVGTYGTESIKFTKGLWLPFQQHSLENYKKGLQEKFS